MQARGHKQGCSLVYPVRRQSDELSWASGEEQRRSPIAQSHPEDEELSAPGSVLSRDSFSEGADEPCTEPCPDTAPQEPVPHPQTLPEHLPCGGTGQAAALCSALTKMLLCFAVL